MCALFYENRLGMKESVISFVYLFCLNTGSKFREPYHSYHVIPHRVKCTSTRKLCKLKSNLYFTHVHNDNFSIVYYDFYHQIMESCINANYTVGVF